MRKTLLVTMDFPPLLGGIAEYYFNLVKKMPNNEIVVLADTTNYKSSTNYKLQITNYNFKVYYKNFFTKFIWPHWLFLIWQIYKVVKQEKVQKIWVGQILPVGTAVWMVSKILKIPYFITCHGNDLLRARQVARKFKLAKKILRAAEFIEANTEFTKNILVNDFKILDEKIKIVYPENTLSREQVDNKKVQELREKYNLQNKKILLTVA